MAGLTAGVAGDPSRSHGGARALAAVALAGAVGMLLLVAAISGLGAATVTAGSGGASEGSQRSNPSSFAGHDIPRARLELYVQAAARYGLDWTVVAAIGRVECDHGRDPDPSCRLPGAVNGAGAGGPMQFIASTWARYAVDGDGDGITSRWDAADAIFSAANYLRSSGAPAQTARAILAYNHSRAYLAAVERWAARYRGSLSAEAFTAPRTGAPQGSAQTPTPVVFIAGDKAQLSPADGHVAEVPVGVPPVVQALIVASNELQDLPYGPGGHPDPRGAPEEDCSSTVNYVLYRAGIRPIAEIIAENPLAQDYVRWGDAGPGRWVTVYATAGPTPHTFIVIAGLRLDTSHNGTDVGPNSHESGPRWRLLAHVPTWAHWSARHPPGL